MNLKKVTHDWVARAECGCVMAVSYVLPGKDREGAQLRAEWAKKGYTIEKLPIAEAVAELQKECPHRPQGQLPLNLEVK